MAKITFSCNCCPKLFSQGGQETMITLAMQYFPVIRKAKLSTVIVIVINSHVYEVSVR